MVLSLMPLAAQATNNTLLVLGDSLSAAHNLPIDQGWVSLLEQRLASADHDWQVVNASISGETSGGGAARISELLDQHQPQALIVELGGNDGLRGLPLGQFRDNLATIIGQARQAGVNVLLVGIDIPTNYGVAYRRRFSEVYTRLAEEFHVPLVPFLLEGVALQPDLMQADGIHPTAAAQPMILDNLWPYLRDLLELDETP
ncbi:MAG: arylesterase [Wenzhouxiangellaceae bacterium]